MGRSDETPDLTKITLSQEQLLAFAKALGEEIVKGSAQVSAEHVAQVAHAASAVTRQWWDDTKYPKISVYNPEGEKAHPKPPLDREVFWLNAPQDESHLTRGEIERMNQLRPGRYHLRTRSGAIEVPNFFTVREREPGMPKSPIQVIWPCADPADRTRVERFDYGDGLGAVHLLDHILEQQPSTKTTRSGLEVSA